MHTPKSVTLRDFIATLNNIPAEYHDKTVRVYVATGGLSGILDLNHPEVFPYHLNEDEPEFVYLRVEEMRGA